MASSRSGFLGFGVAAVLATGLVLRRQKTHRATRLGALSGGIRCRLYRRLGRCGQPGAQAWHAQRRQLECRRPAGDVAGCAHDRPQFPLAGRRPQCVRCGDGAVPDEQSIDPLRAGAQRLPAAARGGWHSPECRRCDDARRSSSTRSAERFREAPHEGTTYWARVGAVIGLLAIAVQSLFEFSLQMPGNAAMFCVLAAIAIHRSPNVRTTDFERRQLWLPFEYAMTSSTARWTASSSPSAWRRGEYVPLDDIGTDIWRLIEQDGRVEQVRASDARCL